MVEQIMVDMIKYYDKDIRRINHAIKVYGFAETICEKEDISEIQRYIVKLSAILHDIGIKEAEKKYNSSAGKYQEIEGPPIARGILQKYRIEEDILERVDYLIGNHHSYGNIDNIDIQILIEADFLVNIDENKIDKESVISIKNKYFKTKTGLEILNSMYLNN